MDTALVAPGGSSMGEWLTLAQAAQRQGLSKKTMRRMVDDSRLLSRMTKGHWEVYIEDVADQPASARHPVLPETGAAEKLLEVFEDLQLLKECCRDHGAVWRLFDASGLLPKNLTFLHWAKVFDRLTVCERTIFSLCRTMNLQFTAIQTVYEELVQIQQLWRKYFLQLSQHGAVEEEKQSTDDEGKSSMLKQEQELFSKILNNLRQLVVASASHT
jgi:hypothetical protein